MSTQQKKQTPPLETSHAIPASHAEEKCKMMRWGGKRGLHRKRKNSKIKNKKKKKAEKPCACYLQIITQQKKIYVG